VAKKVEDLSVLRTRVETYGAELKQTGKEFHKSGTDWLKRFKERPPTYRDMADLFLSTARYVDLMEKHEAALRNFVVALERRVKVLEKKVPKFDVGLER